MPKTAISLQLKPGQKVTLQPVSWQGFEEIMADSKFLKKIYIYALFGVK